MQSDLRVAIFKALGTAGIEIPFNQIDVNLRDLETIKAYLAAVLEQQPNGAARQGLHSRHNRQPSRQREVTKPGLEASCPQSSRKTFSRRSWRSWASSDSVAMGRASRRFRPIGSPVSSQKP